jgi:hypothetical protein
MQIHELTQPKKSKLDEVDFVGPDSVFAQAKSAIQTRGRSLIDPQAAKDAQQARYQADIANSLAQGKAAGLDKKPTLNSALIKLKANPAATQYVAGIVAKWPSVSSMGGTLTQTTTGQINKANPNNPNVELDYYKRNPPKTQPAQPAPTTPVAGTPATAPVADKAAKNKADAAQRNADIEKTKQANAVKNQQDAAIKAAADAAKAKPGFQQTAADKLAIKSANTRGIREDNAQAFQDTTQKLGQTFKDGERVLNPNDEQVKAKIKAWIDSQLKTTSLETLYKAEQDGLEGLKGFGEQIGIYLDSMVQDHNNIPAQQKTLESLVSLVVAANHLVDFERRIGAGNNLRYQARQGTQAQPVQTGLTPAQLQKLNAQAAQAGGPDPRKTGNDFWDNLIIQALGSR